MATTRRRFLGSGLAVGAALAAGAAETETANAPRWRCGLGLNGFMSSGQDHQRTYPIWEILDFAVREGFDGIELVEGWPMGGYPSPDEADRIAALKRLYDQYGLQVYTIQTGGSDAYDASAEKRRAWVGQFAERVRLCQQLGVRLHRPLAGRRTGGQPGRRPRYHVPCRELPCGRRTVCRRRNAPVLRN